MQNSCVLFHQKVLKHRCKLIEAERAAFLFFCCLVHYFVICIYSRQTMKLDKEWLKEGYCFLSLWKSYCIIWKWNSWHLSVGGDYELFIENNTGCNKYNYEYVLKSWCYSVLTKILKQYCEIACEKRVQQRLKIIFNALLVVLWRRQWILNPCKYIYFFTERWIFLTRLYFEKL